MRNCITFFVFVLFSINLYALDHLLIETEKTSTFKSEFYTTSELHKILITNDTIVNKTKSGKVIRDVGVVGKKLLKKIKELFAVKHKVPDNYVFVESIELISKDSLAVLSANKKMTPELKLLYPRITPTKGYFSFQVGDYEYFKYVNDIDINEIEYIKLIAEDGSECFIDKFEFVKKEKIKRHFTFLLDHSGSMGRKRASLLQNALYKAIEKNVSEEQNATYHIYKFSEQIRRIVKGKTPQEIASKLLPTNGLKGFGGGTAVKDALVTAISDLNKENKDDFKIVVLFTDGDSNSDLQQIPMSEVLKTAVENNINIVSVAFGSYLNVGYLKDIADFSGGDLFHIYSPDEFQVLFDNIFQDIILSYDLEFVPCLFGDDVQLEMKIVSNDISLKGQTIFRTPLTEGYTIDLSINFDRSSAKLKTDHFERLETMYNLMNFKPALKIMVEGHSDKLGNENVNVKLSKQRANAVKNYLVKKGISPDRIKTKGFGSSMPAFSYAAGSSENALNRRIQIVIVNN